MPQEFKPLNGLKTQDELGRILCPQCGNEFVHIEKATVYSDKKEGFHIEVEYHCETHGDNGIIRFRHHKGETYLEHAKK